MGRARSGVRGHHHVDRHPLHPRRLFETDRGLDGLEPLRHRSHRSLQLDRDGRRRRGLGLRVRSRGHAAGRARRGGAPLGRAPALEPRAGGGHLYVTFGLLVGAGVSAFYVPLTVLAIKWFEDRRAMAAAVVSAGNGLGILALAPLTRWLINEYDWRVAFSVLGAIALVVVVPCVLLLKGPAAAGSPLRGGGGGAMGERARTDVRHWGGAGAISGPPQMKTFTEAVPDSSPWSTWPFWAIALTHFCCCAAHSGPLFHLVSHAMDQGVA